MRTQVRSRSKQKLISLKANYQVIIMYYTFSKKLYEIKLQQNIQNWFIKRKTCKQTELKTQYMCELDLLNKDSIKLLDRNCYCVFPLLPCSTAFIFLLHYIFLFRSYYCST